MDVQHVTFRFGGELEIRYVTTAPEPGDFVTHGQEIWVVMGVVADDVEGKIAICRPPAAARGGLRVVQSREDYTRDDHT